jgi:hypothetical protein
VQRLAVQRKRGCLDNATPRSAYAVLLAQVPALEGRMDAAAEGPTPSVVLEDFKRRFHRSGDRGWAEPDDGEPTNADPTTLTQDTPVSCRDNTFTELMDHTVVDRRVLPWVDRTSCRQVTCRQADKAVGD